jgi:ABC-type uncharacterized transport system ATPase subunit
VEGLDLPRPGPFGTALKDIGFTIAGGEILGVAGVAGNGQAELVDALSGERASPRPETICLDGRAIGRAGVAERRRLGLCSLPEERNGHAAVPELTLAENALLTARGRAGLAAGGLLRFGATRAFAERIAETFRVKATGVAAPAASLSGGNLQRFVVGREILQNPAVLVVAQPTWGVDAGAAAIIHQALVDLAAEGAAILVVSQDLDELLALSDRIAVLNEGRLSPAMPVAQATLERIGLLMGGVRGVVPALAAQPGEVHAVA